MGNSQGQVSVIFSKCNFAVSNARLLSLGSNILATYRACSTEILLDSSTVFLEYNKIEQEKEGLINTIKLTLSLLLLLLLLLLLSLLNSN